MLKQRGSSNVTAILGVVVIVIVVFGTVFVNNKITQEMDSAEKSLIRSAYVPSAAQRKSNTLAQDLPTIDASQIDHEKDKIEETALSLKNKRKTEARKIIHESPITERNLLQ